MAGAIRYIKFSGDYDKFDWWKEKTKEIARYKGIRKNLTRDWKVTIEEYDEDEYDLMMIYEGNRKAWGFLIINLRNISCGLVIQCNGNAHDAFLASIDTYEVSK